MCGIVALLRASWRSLTLRRSAAPWPACSIAGPTAASLDRPRSQGRPRPCAPEHHRPADRRSADRQPGQPVGDHLQRRVLRLRGDPEGARASAATSLRTRSDSEIALHLYEDLGPQCLHRLRGEFAFVIWDGANRTLFAARDRFGIKPLFYAVARGRACTSPRRSRPCSRPASRRAGIRVAVWQAVRAGRTPGAHLVRRRPPRAAGPLPDRDRSAHADCPLLGLRLSDGRQHRWHSGRTKTTATSFATRWRNGGADPPARRCSGGLLSERRARFLRGARPRRAPSSGSDPRVHPDLRSRRLRRGGTGARRWRRWPAPSSIRSRSGRTISRDTSRDAVHHAETLCRQCARRREIPAEPRGP